MCQPTGRLCRRAVAPLTAKAATSDPAADVQMGITTTMQLTMTMTMIPCQEPKAPSVKLKLELKPKLKRKLQYRNNENDPQSTYLVGAAVWRRHRCCCELCHLPSRYTTNTQNETEEIREISEGTNRRMNVCMYHSCRLGQPAESADIRTDRKMWQG